MTRMDGVVDIWDYFYRQNEVAYSHKVSTQQHPKVNASPSCNAENTAGYTSHELKLVVFGCKINILTIEERLLDNK